MPQFREGLVVVHRGFDGHGLKSLYDAEPEDRITVVNSTYDVSSEMRNVHFSGSSAEAMQATARLIPVEGLVFMGPDSYALERDELINFQAYHAFREAAARLVRETNIFLDLRAMDDIIEPGSLARYREDAPRAEEFSEWFDFEGQEGFFIRTTDPLPFACVNMAVGGSYETG